MAAWAAAAGGGYQSVYTTPWSDSATASSDPFMKQIAVDIAANKDPGTIVLQLMERGDFDQDQLDVYSNAANQMFQERSGFQRNQLNPGQPEQTAMQKWLAATGLPDPTEEYTPETLPADVMPDLNPALARYYKRFTDLDERAKKWAKDARYGPVPSADASADAASALPTEVNGIPIVRQTAADYQAKDTDWIDKIEELRRRGPGQAQRMTGMTPEKWNAYLDRQLQLGRNGEGAGGGGGGGSPPAPTSTHRRSTPCPPPGSTPGHRRGFVVVARCRSRRSRPRPRRTPGRTNCATRCPVPARRHGRPVVAADHDAPTWPAG